MKLIHHFFLLLCLCLAACEFTPQGSHFEEVDPNPVIITSSIDLNLDADTIFLRNAVELQFTITTSGRRFYEYQLLLGKSILKKGNLPNDRFIFDTKKYPNGIHTLKLMVVGSSGTGSLADLAGVEGILEYKTWIVVIDNEPPGSARIKGLLERDGRLVIQWEKYPRMSFKNYRLVKSGGFPEISINLPNRNITEYIDSSYIGGSVAYYLYVIDVDGRSGGGTVASISDPLPELQEIHYNEDTTVSISYTGTRFYNNLSQYEIKKKDQTNQLVYQTSVASASTITAPFNGFGAETHYGFTAVPKKGKLYVEPRESIKSIQYGSRGNGHFDIQRLHYNKRTNTYYRLDNDQVLILNADNFQVVLSKTGPWGSQHSFPRLISLSPDGNYLYVTADSYVWQLDPQTLETLSAYNLKDFIENSSYMMWSIMVSNTNRLAIKGGDWNGTNGRYYVYDFNAGRLVLNQLTNAQEERASISTDGNMIYNSGKLYKWNGVSWDTFKTEIAPGAKAFHPAEDLLAIANGLEVAVYSTATGTKIHAFPVSFPLTDIKFDPATGFLGAHSAEYYHLYDINSGRHLRKIRRTESSRIYLTNKTIFNITPFSEQRYTPFYE